MKGDNDEGKPRTTANGLIGTVVARNYGTVVQRYTLVSRETVTIDGSIFDRDDDATGSATSDTVPASVFREEGTP